MSGARSAVSVPVALRYPEPEGRDEAWGRLIALSASSAELSTQSRLGRGDAVLLSFDLAGEPFKEIAAVVAYAEGDGEGYWRAELRFSRELDRRRLARVLLDLLSRR